MNWVEAKMRRERMKDPESRDSRRNLYRDLLLECVEYLPAIDAYGVDQRTIEEALGDDSPRW
jgi:hypothetical protein